MAQKLYDETAIQSIANAIRTKGVSGTWKVSQMASAIQSIPQSGITPSGTIVINNNGFSNVTNYAEAYVNVGLGYLRFVFDDSGSALYTGSSDTECVNWINSHGKTLKWSATPVFVVN